MSVSSRPLTLLRLLLMATSFVQLASCKPAPIVGGGPSRGEAKGPHPGEGAVYMEDPPSVASEIEVPPAEKVRPAPRTLPEGAGSSHAVTPGTNYGPGGVAPNANSGSGASSPSSSSAAASLALTSGTNGLGVPPSTNSGSGASSSSSSPSSAASLALAQAANSNNNNNNKNYDEGEGEGFGGGPGGGAFSAAFSNGGQSPSAASIAFSGSPSDFFNSGAAGFLNFSFG